MIGALTKAAMARAAEAMAGAEFAADLWDAAPHALVAIGDPQTTADHFFRVLAHRGLLRMDGRLVDGVTLVSMGDHFDFRLQQTVESAPQGMSVQGAAAAGMAILCWLAAHPPDRVRILLGNHDAARVMELVDLDDTGFGAARALGERVAAATNDQERAALTAEFHTAFGRLPTPDVARRDFSAFETRQRDLVAQLLLAGRLQLATHGHQRDGRPVLMTHTGVTDREVAQLNGHGHGAAPELAAALNAQLRRAVAAVAPAWQAGRWEALDLAPLHHAGRTREESGGLLAHRPANPQRPSLSARQWEFDDQRPRRFHPSRLPAGLLQACGHTRHQKLLEELVPWVSPAAEQLPASSLRTLTVAGSTITYRAGACLPGVDDAAMYCTDIDMHRQPAAACDVLRLSV